MVPDASNFSQSQIELETAKIAWSELQSFFAKGIVIHVADGMDLVDVALQFTKDNKVIIKQWMDDNKIALVSDQQAIGWHTGDAELWCMVIPPFVLVQDIVDKKTINT